MRNTTGDEGPDTKVNALAPAWHAPQRTERRSGPNPTSRVRWLGGIVVVAAAATACSATDEASNQQLPPIITTTSTTTTTTTVPNERFYTVQRGDILAVIAATYGVTIESIVELNELDNPDDIQAGQVLEIPANVRVPVPEPAPSTDEPNPTDAP